MFGEGALDGSLQVDQRMETAATDAFSGQHGEEVLDSVEPRAGGRGEVKRPARMPFEPGFDPGMFVGGVVVDDSFDQLTGGHRALDVIEEADELLSYGGIWVTR